MPIWIGKSDCFVDIRGDIYVSQGIVYKKKSFYNVAFETAGVGSKNNFDL